jgi:hypothetical protein
LADTIDGALLAGITVRLVGDGDVAIVHEVNDHTRTSQDAMARRLQRAASGVTGEFAAPVINRQAQGTGIDTTPPAFSQDQVAPTISKPWRVPRPFHLSWLELELDHILLTDHRVVVVIDGLGHESATVPAGQLRAVGIVDRSLHTGTVVRLAVPVAGTGFAGMTATLRGAMI